MALVALQIRRSARLGASPPMRVKRSRSELATDGATVLQGDAVAIPFRSFWTTADQLPDD